jgi:hypothetical protein
MKAACSLDPTRAATVRRLPLCTHLIGENTESRSGNIISVLLEHSSQRLIRTILITGR